MSDIKRRIEEAYKAKSNKAYSNDYASKDQEQTVYYQKSTGEAKPENVINKSKNTNTPNKDSPAKGIWNQAEFIKTGRPGIEKAAKFLRLIGVDEAKKVIQNLKPEEIEQVIAELTKVDTINPEEATQILQEFEWIASHSAAMDGGIETAEKILTQAYGSEKAREILIKSIPESYKPFQFINDLDPKQTYLLLKDESAQMIAVILSSIEPKVASSILAEFSATQRLEIIQKLSKQFEKPSKEIISRVEEALKLKASRMGKTDFSGKIDGTAVLADILKHSGNGLEDDILSELSEQDPELSKNIRDRLFTFDDIMNVSNKDIQKALRNMSEQEIAILLKGRNDNFKDKMLANVSSSKKNMILEEYEILGAIKRSDADKVAKNFLNYFKKKWEEGSIILDGDNDIVS